MASQDKSTRATTFRNVCAYGMLIVAALAIIATAPPYGEVGLEGCPDIASVGSAFSVTATFTAIYTELSVEETTAQAVFEGAAFDAESFPRNDTITVEGNVLTITPSQEGTLNLRVTGTFGGMIGVGSCVNVTVVPSE